MSPFASCGHHLFSKAILNYVHQYHIVCMIALKNAKHNWSSLFTEITVKGVSGMFQGYSKHFIRADQGFFIWCFKGCYGCSEAASRVFQDFFQGNWRVCLRVFQGCSVHRVFKSCVKVIPRSFEECYKHFQ